MEITRQVAAALLKEAGCHTRGIMYGGFITTKDGVKLLEYNARFGDPEAMNIFTAFKNRFLSKYVATLLPEHWIN